MMLVWDYSPKFIHPYIKYTCPHSCIGFLTNYKKLVNVLVWDCSPKFIHPYIKYTCTHSCSGFLTNCKKLVNDVSMRL
jgi:hypothetical protein